MGRIFGRNGVELGIVVALALSSVSIAGSLDESRGKCDPAIILAVFGLMLFGGGTRLPDRRMERSRWE